jgi:hypothetical protein
MLHVDALNMFATQPRLMGLEAIYSKPHTSLSGEPSHRYPYLLRGLSIERCNQKKPERLVLSSSSLTP